MFDVINDVRLSGANSSADCPTLEENLRPFLELVNFQYGAFLLRRHRLRSRLHHIDVSIHPIFCPLHVHGLMKACLF